MKKFIILVPLLALFGAGCIFTSTPALQAMSQPAKFNCEHSAGTVTNNACVCPAEDTFEAVTGYCISSFGNADGEIGKQQQALQNITIEKANK